MANVSVCPRCGRERDHSVCSNCGNEGYVRFDYDKDGSLFECSKCGYAFGRVPCYCGCIYVLNGNMKTDGGSGGGCYITTAVCSSLGKPDDCDELTMLRKFRDGFLAAETDGKALIEEYYNSAPAIVQVINSKENASGIYMSIYEKFIVPCINLIEQGKNTACKDLYSKMVNTLRAEYLL